MSLPSSQARVCTCYLPVAQHQRLDANACVLAALPAVPTIMQDLVAEAAQQQPGEVLPCVRCILMGGGSTSSQLLVSLPEGLGMLGCSSVSQKYSVAQYLCLRGCRHL